MERCLVMEQGQLNDEAEELEEFEPYRFEVDCELGDRVVLCGRRQLGDRGICNQREVDHLGSILVGIRYIQ